uniref:Uncharacterized protein n=1 Tax=Anguilla anguilla TaxID=7936 RepID=A0A0E9W1S3_ANGAN
MLCTLNNVLT